MLWSVKRVIFKTSSVTPDFSYVFNLILSFSTCSQNFNKICTWEDLGANVLKSERIRKWILRFSTKQINLRSFGSWCVKGTEESTLEVDSPSYF